MCCSVLWSEPLSGLNISIKECSPPLLSVYGSSRTRVEDCLEPLCSRRFLGVFQPGSRSLLPVWISTSCQNAASCLTPWRLFPNMMVSGLGEIKDADLNGKPLLPPCGCLQYCTRLDLHHTQVTSWTYHTAGLNATWCSEVIMKAALTPDLFFRGNTLC